MVVSLSGQLICATAEDVSLIHAYLPEHIRLSRAEPGCLSFEVLPSDDPLICTVEEQFTDQAAFDAHQTRTRASEWFRVTAGIRRVYTITA